jgi:hypothetical protein
MAMPKIPVFMGALATLLMAAPVQAAPITFLCNTPSDQYSHIEQNISTKSFEIKGSIQPLALKEGKYAAQAQILLESSDKKTALALQLTDSRKKGTGALAWVRVYKNGKQDEPILVGSAKISEKLIFSITITDGRVHVRAGEIEASAIVTLSDQVKMRIICSTGTFQFSDLKWSSQ